ncbi:unnamed protein product [Adineta ricciae]|uniref:Ig-like domain-containing protein n=1 Tax=Adineta ricciae TaxID=249248 RepID=A0A813XDA0_ADIRI|nr:unnamed protein product [Adineta ricciae]
MRVTRGLFFVLLLNWTPLQKIVAIPVDEFEQEASTTSIFSTDTTQYNSSYFSSLHYLTASTDSTISSTDSTVNTDSTISSTDSTVSTDPTISSTDSNPMAAESSLFDVENSTQFNDTDDSITSTFDKLSTIDAVKLRVVVGPKILQIHRGQITYELTCTVYGVDASTHIYWSHEELYRRYVFTDKEIKSASPWKITHKTHITVVFPNSLDKYTCVARDIKGNTVSDTVSTQIDSDTHDQNFGRSSLGFKPLRIIAPDTNDKDHVEIECTGADSYDESKIKWYFNNRRLVNGHPFYPRGKILLIDPVTPSQSGNYRCTIGDHRYVESSITLTFSKKPDDIVHPVFDPASPLSINEGESQLIRCRSGYYLAYCVFRNGQRLPSGVYQNGNILMITNATSRYSGMYNCTLMNNDGKLLRIPYEIQVKRKQTHNLSRSMIKIKLNSSIIFCYFSFVCGLPKLIVRPQIIDLVEGQRLIIEYTVISEEPVEIVWKKYVNHSYESISSAFIIESDRLILQRATLDVVGTYQVIVRNSYGESRQNLRINVKPRRSQQRESVQVTIQPKEIIIEANERTILNCDVKGAQQYRVTWNKFAYNTSLPDYAHQQGNDLIIFPSNDTPTETMYFECQVDVSGESVSYNAYVQVTIGNGKSERSNTNK